jgi:short-subunit dehydrogenase
MKRALIIGATSAIAEALAGELAKTGASLFLAGRCAERLELIARDLKVRHGVEVETAAIDFDDFDQHAPLIDRAAERLGGLDLAVICHGSLPD